MGSHDNKAFSSAPTESQTNCARGLHRHRDLGWRERGRRAPRERTATCAKSLARRLPLRTSRMESAGLRDRAVKTRSPTRNMCFDGDRNAHAHGCASAPMRNCATVANSTIVGWCRRPANPSPRDESAAPSGVTSPNSYLRRWPSMSSAPVMKRRATILGPNSRIGQTCRSRSNRN